jgi:hypothetical protein
MPTQKKIKNDFQFDNLIGSFTDGGCRSTLEMGPKPVFDESCRRRLDPKSYVVMVKSLFLESMF